ncbi:peptidoglycan recognition protein family protein [Planomonospora parontospora]|uniref:peptidoglycan recognition protein family protein n=1 Tax=Planomonospora parontospora TaxID=58119 RepID=UPI001781A03F|nr:N-acetylmuramoyl-L-alanine amidase [Planomonospora parontospora]
MKVHYTGGYVPPGIVDDHRICIELVLAFQRMHMSGGRGETYIDLGYSLVACPHQRVFMGRGPGVVPAANGAGLNSGHYAVLALVGSSGFTEPNDGMLHAVVDAIEYLRREGGAGREVKGHRDGYATSCPGGPLYAWVRAGARRPKTAPAKPVPAPKPEITWTETLIVKNLPGLKPGDEHRHVKTMRAVLFARGVEPKNLHSMVYEPGGDLQEKVLAFKAAKKLGDGPAWTRACWIAALS